jgi:hypothetical protein
MDTPLGHFDPARLAPRPIAKPSGWRRAVPMLVGALVGAAGSVGFILLHRAGAVPLPGPMAMAAGFVALFPALWLQTLLHEAGHAVAGLLGGKRAVGFGLGPWRFERGQGGWHARRGGGVQGIGGFAMLLSDGERGAGRGADALFLLGGPLTNVALAAGAYAALVASPDMPVWATAALGTFALVGVVLGVVNLIPFRSRGWSTDGMGLVHLLRRDAAAAVARVHRELIVLAFRGVRPRDWPPALLGSVPEAATLTPHERVMLASMRLQAALDRGDALPARAAALELAAAHAAMPDGVRQGIAVGLAAHAVQVEQDAELACAWLELSAGGLLDLSTSRAWIAAEVALLRDDAAQAAAQLALARQGLPRVHDAGSHAMLEERLARLEARLAGSALAA